MTSLYEDGLPRRDDLPAIGVWVAEPDNTAREASYRFESEDGDKLHYARSPHSVVIGYESVEGSRNVARAHLNFHAVRREVAAKIGQDRVDIQKLGPLMPHKAAFELLGKTKPSERKFVAEMFADLERRL